jgi:hypothetical protein
MTPTVIEEPNGIVSAPALRLAVLRGTIHAEATRG